MNAAAARLAISLFGPFAVRGPDGSDLTPRSQKACALLALLCEAPDLRRTRAALQDKLWSDRGQAQGAASLRQTLTEIRKALGEHREVLRSDIRMVSLDPDAVSVDVADPKKVAAAAARDLIYLDGIGVRDPEFEDWLRDRRLALEEGTPAASSLPAAAPPLALPSKPGPPVLYLSATSKDGAAMFSEHILHAVARGVSDVGVVDVRSGFDADAGRIAYLLEAGEQAVGDGTALHIRLSTMPGRSVCWQRSDILTAEEIGRAGPSLARLINQCIDSTIAAFAGSRPFGSLASTDPAVVGTAAAVRRMWASAGSNPRELIAELEESFERQGRGIDLAWQAFVWCFVVGERRDSPATNADARRLIHRAIELEPDNSLVLALASHVYGFVLREFEVALDLAERSVRLDRNNILGWAFLGVARVNVGRREEGYRAASHARRIAGEGPYREFVDGLAALTACLTGRFEEATILGEATHAMRPTFAAPLRYLIASYLLTGDHERARLTVHRLRQIEPDFQTSLLAEPEYPVEPLRRSGLIDVRKVPSLT